MRDESVNKNIELTPEKFIIIGEKDTDSEKILRPSMTYWQDAWRRLKQNKIAISALIILVIISIMAVIGPLISGKVYSEIHKDMINLWPSTSNWFGTDNLGRDVFSRGWQGARVSIAIGIVGALVDAIIGAAYGGISG